MSITDGIYIVADGDQLNVNYPQILPGVYVSAGEAVFGATWQTFGISGTRYDQGAGLFGETTIVIPRMAYAFQTAGMEPWVRIADPPTLWLRMWNGSWLNLTDPQPDAPADLIGSLGWYYPWQMRLRAPGPQWYYQGISYLFGDANYPLRIRMPDGYWLYLGNFTPRNREGFSPGAQLLGIPGFQLDVMRYGSNGATDSTPIWFVRETTDGVSDDSGGLSIADLSWSEVEVDSDGDIKFDIQRVFYSVDLDLVRWMDRAFNPNGDFSLSLRFFCRPEGSEAVEVSPGEIDILEMAGQIRLLTATGASVDTDTYINASYASPGNFVPRLSLTGEPVGGSELFVFNSTFSTAADLYEQPISLSALEGLRRLDFELVAVTPDTPDPPTPPLVVWRRVQGSLGIYLAFNP